MLIYIAKRLLVALGVAATVSVITFLMLFASGDPAAAIAGENASASDIEAVRSLYGLDRPLHEQYLSWAGGVLSGDLGTSYYFRAPVAGILLDRLPVTMTLGLCAILFALAVAIPLGVLAAMRPNSLVDRAALMMSVLGQAMPSFWLALVLISIFSVSLGLLPVSGAESWRHFVLPTIVLGYYATPAVMRLTRAGMIDVLASDYIRTARAKGLSTGSILFKHALRNAVIPVVSLAAVQFGFMLGGSVVIETVFALHGAGHLALESINRNDLPTVQALILVLSMIFILLTLTADLLNAWLDPRIRVA